MAEDQVTLTIDGKGVTVPKGTSVLEAASGAGIDIPHFCYHPDLSIAGCCRMCHVEIEKMPKLAIACNTVATDGMVVKTPHTSERARKTVRDVLEQHFINHPIDCPICDQSGECKLQDYYYEWGLYQSRFKEQKVVQPKNQHIGPMVVLDADRCIACSRCVRFCAEVPKTEELCIINRGDRSEITLGTGKTLDNPYSANVVDICPVGAHTLLDFRFQCRAWYLKVTSSVCAGCARGCSITVGQRRGRVYRLLPRRNPRVNGPWMCDAGRLTYKRLYEGTRLERPMVRREGALVPAGWDEAIAEAARLLSSAGERAAGLGSPHATNEENLLLGLVLDALKATRRAVGTSWEPRGVDDELLLRADLSPNRTGAQRLLGQATLGDVLEGAEALLVLDQDPLQGAPSAVGAALLGGVGVVALSTHLDETARAAAVALPVAAFYERAGTVTNFEGHTQVVAAAVPPPGEARAATEVLADLIAAVGGKAIAKRQPADLFGEVARKVAELKGQTLATLGDLGAGGSKEAGK
jgi:NADH-quinone oxidoreductase subunit G